MVHALALMVVLSAAVDGVAVRVAAASDLTFALPELKAAFARAHPDVPLEVTLGSSGVFFAQIQQHAPFDVFLCANQDYVARLVDLQLAQKKDVFSYATGQLVLWYPPQTSAAVVKLGLGGLQHARKVALANPRHAPYGVAAQQALDALGLTKTLKGRLVLGDNVSAAATLAQGGAVDAALLAKSVTLAPAMAGGTTLDVPGNLYAPLVQAGAVLSRARNAEAARVFSSFMQTTTAQDILRKHGFLPPPPG